MLHRALLHAGRNRQTYTAHGPIKQLAGIRLSSAHDVELCALWECVDARALAPTLQESFVACRAGHLVAADDFVGKCQACRYVHSGCEAHAAPTLDGAICSHYAAVHAAVTDADEGAKVLGVLVFALCRITFALKVMVDDTGGCRQE